MGLLERKAARLERLLDAAEARIARDGFASLRARDVASDIAVSLGGIYNLVVDMDDVILRVSVRTLSRLDAALTASVAGAGSADEALSAIAVAYCRFARDNLNLWRALFEHRMPGDLPAWQADSQRAAFRQIAVPLARLLPQADPATVDMVGRTLFSAVHGVVSIGLEGRLLSVPVEELERQVCFLARAACAGLPAALAKEHSP